MEIIRNNFLIIVSLAVAVLLGGIGGYYTFYKFGPVGNMCVIEYISQEEIMALEKKRIQSQDLTDKEKNLFYGKGKEVTEIISRIAHDHKGNKTKIILTAGTIRGNNIRSLSREIHQKVITELETSNVEIKADKP